ncbi:MAG: RluA family pseudouridine synthase [Desulfovibrio sp.]|nr:MAG: RluA family pseudouridine synthase [Desulfovibrio sp.]
MHKVSHISVTPAEAGQKLLNFLQRRLGGQVPKSALMRWIRTGQVRVDGKRAKPFFRLDQDMVVRIPPHTPGKQDPSALASTVDHGPRFRVAHGLEDLLVVEKPSGLPMHGGSKQDTSLQSLLATQFADADFAPTPAHRLDKDTSGLVLVALSYSRLAELHELFRERKIAKLYLAWVSGRIPVGERWTMEDQLAKAGNPGKERVEPGSGKTALAEAVSLQTENEATLLAVRLLTGRTHQIRAQLSSRGFPLMGDVKYGGPVLKDINVRMLLHCAFLGWAGEGYSMLPDWPEPYGIDKGLDLPALFPDLKE